jgi:hypothetical protein
LQPFLLTLGLKGLLFHLMSMPSKNQLGGIIFGILFCGFPALVLFLSHEQHKEVPLQLLAVLALFFIWGLWMFLSGLFKLNAESSLSYFAGSIITAGFAVVAFLVAWREKEGWSGGIPFVPKAWNQAIARSVIALGGLLLIITAVAFFRKAIGKHRKV